MVFRPDLRDDAWLTGLKQADNVAVTAGAIHPRDSAQPATLVVIEMASPYVVAQGHGIIDGDDATTEVSTDGQSWKPADRLRPRPRRSSGSTATTSASSSASRSSGIELTSVVQHNQEALPYLAPGQNRITVTAANRRQPGADPRWWSPMPTRSGWRDETPEELCERGAEIARAHFATWSAQPIVVQNDRSIAAGQFELPVPTPKGKQPVYPRMLFVRREVLPPGTVAAAPCPPRRRSRASEPNEELATLPNPWLIGTRPPARGPSWATKAAVSRSAKLPTCPRRARSFEHQFMKWLKDNSRPGSCWSGSTRSRLPDVEAPGRGAAGAVRPGSPRQGAHAGRRP